jgi:hypothetical protein
MKITISDDRANSIAAAKPLSSVSLILQPWAYAILTERP